MVLNGESIEELVHPQGSLRVRQVGNAVAAVCHPMSARTSAQKANTVLLSASVVLFSNGGDVIVSTYWFQATLCAAFLAQVRPEHTLQLGRLPRFPHQQQDELCCGCSRRLHQQVQRVQDGQEHSLRPVQDREQETDSRRYRQMSLATRWFMTANSQMVVPMGSLHFFIWNPKLTLLVVTWWSLPLRPAEDGVMRA